MPITNNVINVTGTSSMITKAIVNNVMLLGFVITAPQMGNASFALQVID
jgi:hypothetical protein